MKQTARIISIYAADTSGVCSALYELGGMTVVHDASGCNSTYSTHDEPRWYDTDSMIYISALTELDAIMGNDDKLINDISEAASELKPAFITLCGSPMPMMTGTDFDALAAEAEARMGIPTLALHTNGMHSYLEGAGEAFEALAKRFCTERPNGSVRPRGINILGATPLDFSLCGSVASIKELLEGYGFECISCFAMGSTLEEISRAGSAEVNLVVSYSGLRAAEYLRKKFGTPYVCGVPIGRSFAGRLADELNAAVRDGKCRFPCAVRSGVKKSTAAVVGESIFAGSLASALMLERGIEASVLCPLETDSRLIADCDRLIPDEEDFELASADFGCVIADPLYKPACAKGAEFIPLAHEAFSGRCFEKSIPDLIGGGFAQLMI